MKKFVVEMTKTIVMEVEAKDEASAVDYCTNEDDGFDGAWDRAEPVCTVLEEGEVK